MNRGFRKAFLNLFRCFKRIHEPKRRISLGGAGGGAVSIGVSVGGAAGAVGTAVGDRGNGAAAGGGDGIATTASVIVSNGATQFTETDVHRLQTQRLSTDSPN